MKKFIIAILMIVGSFGYANAQTVKKAVHKKTTTTVTTASTPADKKVTKVEKITTHVKKDGTADKRFKENKTTTKTTTGPLKKDGTADMRYKANKKK